MDYTNQKWLFISSMQKAIRRGMADEALILWNESRKIESFYAAYRLSIIAIEDVGLGNEDLVHDFLSTSLKKAEVEKKGGEEYLKSVVVGLANSNKDRSACDLTWMVGGLDLGNVNQEELIEIYKNSPDIFEKALAAWLIVGTKKIKHGVYSYDDKNEIDTLVKINKELNYDEKANNVLLSSINYHKEPHIFAYPILKSYFDKEKDMMIGNYKSGDVYSPKLNNPIFYLNDIPILLSAVDGHTSEGKKVIDKLSTNKKVINILKNDNGINKDYMLKHALFKAEGQIVNKRLIYPTATEIFKKSNNFYQSENFKIQDLVQVVLELNDEINNIRYDTLNKLYNKSSFKNSI